MLRLKSVNLSSNICYLEILFCWTNIILIQKIRSTIKNYVWLGLHILKDKTNSRFFKTFLAQQLRIFK